MSADKPGAESGEEALIATRIAKADRLRAEGQNPFANDVVDRTDVAVARASADDATTPQGRHDPEKVKPQAFTVAGRVIFLRAMGGITFVKLRDRTGELQLYCDEAVLGEAYGRIHRDLDLGDFVEAHGTTMATQKGELSINADRVRLITKAYHPLPTKTSFKDVESRYRQRYVDLVANPSVAAVFRARTTISAAVREFLDTRGFLEVETPTMSTLVGGATAKPFTTHHNALGLDMFLRVAPELYLKRLVVGGFERVYEMARCYRNEGLSTRHNPEFTMLEFYEAYATYRTLMDTTEALLRHVDGRLAEALPKDHAAWNAERRWSFEQFVKLPMREGLAAALEKAGLPSDVAERVHLADAPIKEWAKTSKGKAREIDWTNFRKAAQKCESSGERLFAAYEYVAEPFLTADYKTPSGKSAPVFVIDHPFEVSPLARKKDADPSLVDRFELFVDQRELCNAFSELNDPADQADRFRAQVEKRAKGAEETMDYDADYIRALEHGMPPAAGFGMGIDRLVMLLTGAPSIRDVILFPLMKPAAAAPDQAPPKG